MNSSQLPRNLSITSMQAQRLIHYIQLYRRFAWENIEPTAERNATFRALQALHGRIISTMNPQSEQIVLSIMPDEWFALKMMSSHVLSLYEASPATRERTMAITDLSGLKAFLSMP